MLTPDVARPFRRPHRSDLPVQPRPAGEVIRRVAVYLRPYPGLALATLACAVLSLGAGFLYPKLTRYLIDEVIGGGRSEALHPAALGLLGAFLMREIFNSLHIRVNNRLEQNVIFDMRGNPLRLQRLPVPWLESPVLGRPDDPGHRRCEPCRAPVDRRYRAGDDRTPQHPRLPGLYVLGQPDPRPGRPDPPALLVAGALWYTTTAHHRYRQQREASSAMNALLMDNLQGIAKSRHSDARTTRTPGSPNGPANSAKGPWS